MKGERPSDVGQARSSSVMMTTSDAVHASIAPEKLYWAVLDPKPLGRRLIARSECGFLFEDALPVPIESVHASYRWLADGRVVACGIDRGRLEAIDRTRMLTLVPSAIPEPVRAVLGETAATALGSDDLNLLVGAFEPVAVGRARRRWLVSVASIAIVITSLVVVGVVRRGIALERAVGIVDERRAELLKAAYAGERASASALPPEYRLVGELRQLTGTRSTDLPALFDAGPATAAIVAAWPEDVDARCDAILVTDRTATLRGTATDSAMVSRLEDAYRAVPGWTMQASPQFSSSSTGVAFTITLTRSEPSVMPGEERR